MFDPGGFDEEHAKLNREVTVCKECKFAEVQNIHRGESERSSYALSQLGKTEISGLCLSLDAPVSDFVHGSKNCQVINNYGKCEFFQSLSGESKPIRKVYKFGGITYNHVEKIEITGLSEICRGLEVISSQLDQMQK